MKHPAKYSNEFIPVFAELLDGCESVLDPMAGTGKLALIKQRDFSGLVYCNDILDWGDCKESGVDVWTFRDAVRLPYSDCFFDAICTSPTYGNRMADHFDASNSKGRITYRHCYGQPLSEDNTGRMQWGSKYRGKHKEIYRECLRVLRPGGIFILNISDHVRRGARQTVTAWTVGVLIEYGLTVVEKRNFETKRMRFGENADVRVDCEHVITLRKERL